MNYGILHNRRARDGKTKGLAAGPIPLQRIASQMGVDPAELGAEAQNIWSMLDDMSQNDPQAYREFIANQVSEERKASRQKFTPTPGFVVKYSVAVDGRHQKLFMNCCAHACVAMPKNPNNGKDVPKDTRMLPYTSNLEIPLAIGEVRSVMIKDERCQVVDAVFNPWVLERAQWDAKFKTDAMQLASSWVEKEKNVKLILPGKLIKSLYKGGSGSGTNVITHDFIVDTVQDSSSTDDDIDNNASPKRKAAARATTNLPPPQGKVAPTTLLQTPTDVLRGLGPTSNQDSCNDEEPSNFTMKLPSAVGATKKKPLIEVVGETSKALPVASAAKAAPPASRKKKAPVVQKGFLNNATKAAPLYPNGSTEGRASSAYVNLLHRSKVIDMNSMPSQSDPAKTLPPKRKPPQSSGEKEVVDFEFDQLCLEAEPELANHGKGPLDANPFLNEDLTSFLMGKI
ncbi:hypothetical protein H310_01433 [Aphanomyces invadans]|uniref:PIH1 N-terminal domain-containing protein n=1 Tax=Aphanomyces invadans TaxID=157072 RepID=A0A024UTL0_9STRA|nr:hypothetical protein H310_01433 [Aphanomyces invadans]ETW08953.1 hypothetical protein H310_01433 [Aphanomyces invadans]|eukprot:XP_008862758.1 hypothetical protein H310_01433 [Aphanomyces invadans]